MSLDALDAAERLAAAWARGRAAIEGPIATAFGLADLGGTSTTPGPGVRRVFAMGLAERGDHAALRVLAEEDPDVAVRASACQGLARTLRDGDTAVSALLARWSLEDPALEVRQAIVQALPADAPDALRACAPRWLHDPEPAMQLAAVDRLFAWDPAPRQLLEAVSSRSVAVVEHALRRLRTSGAQVAWEDVPYRVTRRGLPVLAELALVFARRPEAVPVDVWLALARDVEALVTSSRDAVLGCLAVALERAGAGSTARSSDVAERADEVLRLLGRCLPRLSHGAYLELRAAGVVDDPTARPSAPLTAELARIWAALLRLSGNPARHQLRPAYR